MKRKDIIFGIILLLTSTNFAFSQTNKEKAYKIAIEAVGLMDNGKIEESIKMLKEAQKLDPENFDYPYELAYAHYASNDYAKSIEILEKIKKHKDVSDRFFQLLGNAYDMLGKTDKAIETYDEGLKIFPNSGKIYLEKGTIYWNKEKLLKALSFYEKGIEVDPSFPSNYYRATLLYCSSTEEVWGMIYGEIFMNIERNSRRTVEISKLLFDTYKSEIVFKSDTSFSVSFSQNEQISLSDISKNKIKLPFGSGMYGPTLILSIISEKVIDINSLSRIRERFINLYYKDKLNEQYPNVLFDYQKRIKDAGHFDAYNHWILMKGDETNFNVWYSDNKTKWDDFVKWFTNNALKLDKKHKFHSTQY